MSSFIRHLIFFALAFSLDVRVHAAQKISLPNARTVIQEPPGCLEKKRPCALRTTAGQKWTWSPGEDLRVTLGPSTSLILLSPRRARLLDGFIWVRTKEAFRVESEFGAIQGQGPEFWVLRKPQQILARASEGDLLLLPRGAMAPLGLPVGAENWMSAVSRKGEARSGFPQPIPLDDHLTRWAQLREGSKESFSAEFEAFLTSWQGAVERMGDLQQQTADREIANALDQKQRQQMARERARREAAEIRSLFRKRNYLDP